MEEDFKIEPLKEFDPIPKLKLPQFSKTLKLALLGVGLLLLGVVLFITIGKPTFAERNVKLSVEGPSQASSGDEVTYIVKYTNENRVDLKDVSLIFSYPVGVVPIPEEGAPQHITGNQVVHERVEIGLLKEKESGEQAFKAFMVGSQGSIKTAKANFTFTPVGVPTQLTKTTELNTTISALPIPLIVVAPPTVVSGQEISYIIDYRNQTNENFERLRIRVQYPEGFIPKENRTLWEVGSLSPGEGERITIDGVLNGRERETKTISVQIQKQIPTSTGVVYVDFERMDASSVMSTPPVSMSVQLNGSRDYTARLNDTMDYNIRVTNNTDTDLTNFRVTARLTGTMYDMSTIESNGSFDSRTSTILWNPSVVQDLGLLRANQSVTIPFKLRLKRNFPAQSSAGNSSVKVAVALETFDVPEFLNVDQITASDELVTRISTEPGFSQDILVMDANSWGLSPTSPGSEGPYPPIVNQTTGFTVRWTLVNPANDISNAKVTAVLPPGVVWRNQFRLQSATTEPVYDSRNGTVTWNIGILPPNTGIAFPAYQLDFRIAVVPSENDVSNSLLLIKQVVFEGTDVLTKEKITRTLQDGTTGSVSDTRAGGSVKAQ